MQRVPLHKLFSRNKESILFLGKLGKDREASSVHLMKTSLL